MRLLFLTLFLFSRSICSAELQQCSSGIWTNVGCDGAVERSLQEIGTPQAKLEIDRNAYNKKRGLLLGFQSYRRSLQDSGGFYLDTLEVDDVCLANSATVEECESVIKRYEKRLGSFAKIHAEQTKSKEKKASEGADGPNQVVIIDNRDPYEKYYWHGRRPHDHLRPRPNPALKPQVPQVIDPGYTLSDQLTDRKANQNHFTQPSSSQSLSKAQRLPDQ